MKIITISYETILNKLKWLNCWQKLIESYPSNNVYQKFVPYSVDEADYDNSMNLLSTRKFGIHCLESFDLLLVQHVF